MKIIFPDWFERIKVSLLDYRQQGHLVAIITTLLILMIGIIWLLLSPPAPKPLPSIPPKVAKPIAEDFLICVAQGQITTGYTEPSWGPPGSSGYGYHQGSVAVHPRVGTQWGGDPRNPIIPFGTVLHLINPKSIKINDQWYDQVTVNDTGDINLRLWPGDPYWFDIYFGSTNNWTNQAARAYGTHKVDYYWVEKWR